MNFYRIVIDKQKLFAILLFLIFAVLLTPLESRPEFYKYIDEAGRVHYVDSKGKIPRKYRKDLTTYKEKYDHLSEEERAQKIAEDRQKIEEERQRKAAFQKQQQEKWEEKIRLEKLAQEELLKKQEKERLEKEKQQPKIDRENFIKDFESKVIIDGIHTLVPCTLGYKNKEMEVYLLLDTGCTLTTIHAQAAGRLKFKGKIKSKARLAGGETIKINTGKLDYIKIGPYKIDGFYVNVLEYDGPKIRYEGYLGMNFLAGRKYNIDYLRSVIRWVP